MACDRENNPLVFFQDIQPVRQDSVNFIERGSDEIPQELRCFHLAVPYLGSISELARAIDGDEQVKSAFFCPYFGDVDMFVADGIFGKLSSSRFLAFHLRQVADVMAPGTSRE